MKRLICITGIILIACVITGAVVTENSTVGTQYTANQDVTKAESEEIYILKAENGLLTVYRKGDDTAYITTETITSNLPKSDADMLEKGIEVIGNDRLRKALEDYCS